MNVESNRKALARARMILIVCFIVICMSAIQLFGR